MGRQTTFKDVQTYEFNPLEGRALASGEAKAYEFQTLTSGFNQVAKPTEKIIRAERQAEAQASFKVDAIVRELRGLSGQEKSDLEAKINQQVEVRLQAVKEEAYRQGQEQGRMEGASAALKEAMAKHEVQIEQMEGMLTSLRASCEERLQDHRHDIYEASKRLVKWLVLKEIQDEGYLPKLLEKLILEMNQRHNLIIKVNSQDFQFMPEILERLEARLGALSNVRVVPDLDMQGRGIILETENGILDASPDALLQTLDKLYETVVSHGR